MFWHTSVREMFKNQNMYTFHIHSYTLLFGYSPLPFLKIPNSLKFGEPRRSPLLSLCTTQKLVGDRFDWERKKTESSAFSCTSQ